MLGLLKQICIFCTTIIIKLVKATSSFPYTTNVLALYTLAFYFKENLFIPSH